MMPSPRSFKATLGRRYQQGLSLLEVMVAMGIGLLLIAGVTQLFIGSNQNFVVKESVSRMQEDVRFAMDQFQRDMRMAGFRGCTRDLTDHLNPAGTQFEEFLLGSTPVFGWEYSSTSGGSNPGSQLRLRALEADSVTHSWGAGPVGAAPSLAILPGGAAFFANVQPGSDMFVVSLGEVHNVPVTGANLAVNPGLNLAAGSQLPVTQGGIVIVNSGDCATADRFQRTNEPGDGNFVARANGFGNPSNQATTNLFSTNYDDGNATLVEYRSWLYFIRPTAEGPELARRQIGPGTAGLPIETVVQGVENMQVLYGVSTGGLNNRVNQYVTAEDVTDWGDVMSLRIALLLRTMDPVNPDTNFRSYNLLGTEIFPSGVTRDDVDGDRFIRLVATTTVGLRNKLE
ncbi:PilW family protein [Salinispirillum sp. LH 10-3-1]|uniref:PilW family protein n=1 Tax=Salinispirillum sp. LH 10-3-1 TaxID=2952525 RepID=A0AB38YIB7_9GAMM